LNDSFADIVTKGAIAASEPLPAESAEAAGLARIVLHFNRRQVGRLRMLVDRLNSFVAEPASPALTAIGHEIVANALSPEDEQEAEAEALDAEGRP
jgi:hypothetical protein